MLVVFFNLVGNPHYITLVLHVGLPNPVWVEEDPVYFTHLAGQVGVPEGLHQPQDLRDVPMNTRNESAVRMMLMVPMMVMSTRSMMLTMFTKSNLVMSVLCAAM